MAAAAEVLESPSSAGSSPTGISSSRSLSLLPIPIDDGDDLSSPIIIAFSSFTFVSLDLLFANREIIRPPFTMRSNRSKNLSRNRSLEGLPFVSVSPLWHLEGSSIYVTTPSGLTRHSDLLTGVHGPLRSHGRKHETGKTASDEFDQCSSLGEVDPTNVQLDSSDIELYI